MTRKLTKSEKNPCIAAWGMSGLKRCIACGAVLRTEQHECNSPVGFILENGVWKEKEG